MHICISCLAWDRQLFPVDQYMTIIADITQSMKVFLLNGKVCWECKALLKKIYFFKERMLKSIKLFQEYGDLNKLQQQHTVQTILSRTKVVTLDCPPVSNVQTTVVKPIDRFLTNNLPNIQTTGIQPIDGDLTKKVPSVQTTGIQPIDRDLTKNVPSVQTTVVQPLNTVLTKNVSSVQTTVVQPINTVLTENLPSVQTTVVQPINTVLTNNLCYINQNESQSIINGINNLSPPMLVPIKKLIPLNVTVKTEQLDIDIVKEELIDSVATNEDKHSEQPPVVSGESDCMIDCIIENPPKKERIDKYQKMIEEPEMTEEPGLWSSELVTDSEMQRWRKEDENDVKYMKSQYKCVRCILGFEDAKSWRKHHEIYHDRKIGQYVCDICQIRFTEEYILNNHRDNHKRLYKCLNCGLSNRRRMVIVDHCKTVHNNVKINNSCDCNNKSNCEKCRKNKDKKEPHLMSYNYAYKCGVCSEKVITRNELTKHIEDQHSDLTKNSQDAEDLRPYGCGDCEKKFRFSGELLSHRLLFHRRQLPARATFTSKS